MLEIKANDIAAPAAVQFPVDGRSRSAESGRPMGRKNHTRNGAKWDRKPIFTPAQKVVLNRLIAASLKAELRTLVKSILVLHLQLDISDRLRNTGRMTRKV